MNVNLILVAGLKKYTITKLVLVTNEGTEVTDYHHIAPHVNCVILTVQHMIDKIEQRGQQLYLCGLKRHLEHHIQPIHLTYRTMKYQSSCVINPVATMKVDTTVKTSIQTRELLYLKSAKI